METTQEQATELRPKSLERPRVAELDLILGKPFPVLDDGFVRVVDYMGDDRAIVQAARVSYGEGTKKLQDDRGLIRYLMRHRHTTPFEMAEIKLHVRVPMDVWRQWIRHRMASVNEYSTRYSVAIDAAQRTGPAEWRKQSSKNGQGSDGTLPETEGKNLSVQEQEFLTHARSVYEERLAKGVAREQARKDLPLSTYTEAYWKIDLHNLLHFLGLRMEAHAQEEIRAYANLIGESIVAKWVPLIWEAFQDYRLEALSLTKPEIQVLHLIFKGEDPKTIARRHGWLEPDGKGGWKRNREREEFEGKLLFFGIPKPW